MYIMQKRNDEVINLVKRFVTNCSSDGWYWNINHYVGDIFSQNNEWNLTSDQYNLSLLGIRRIIKDQASRKDTLFKLGNMIKPNNFVSWEDESLKFYSSTIDKTTELLRIARSH